MHTDINHLAPPFARDDYTAEEAARIAPFFTNLDRPTYAVQGLPPEMIGALCSRTSRAKGDLRHVFLREYIEPFVNPERDEDEDEEAWRERLQHGRALTEFIAFLQHHSLADIFANPKARSFYTKWLAQYGDDSIAQMAGMHVVYSGISQIAIKHLQDQRIGLAPIEKSTRYVDYSAKVGGTYAYYTDPRLTELGLRETYKAAMDHLFDTYTRLVEHIKAYFAERHPDEKPSVISKKAYDTLRGLLPMATLSQVAFFGNGQSFEYMVNRCRKHRLGELRWVGETAYRELSHVTPAFLRRVEGEKAEHYQEYLATRRERVAEHAHPVPESENGEAQVHLVEYDPLGETKILTGILYDARGSHASWGDIFAHVQTLPHGERRAILEKYLAGRSERWQKVGRAFENAFLRFDILMNIGAWRDLHRHRMHTQQRQQFTVQHGFDVPPEIISAGVRGAFEDAIARAENIYHQIAQHDEELAQYAVTLAHRVRFMQWQNVREFFWEAELRTIPEGHPDYRVIEQKKFRLFQRVYPLIAEFVHANMDDYAFARRGQEERIIAKERTLRS